MSTLTLPHGFASAPPALLEEWAEIFDLADRHILPVAQSRGVPARVIGPGIYSEETTVVEGPEHDFAIFHSDADPLRQLWGGMKMPADNLEHLRIFSEMGYRGPAFIVHECNKNQLVPGEPIPLRAIQPVEPWTASSFAKLKPPVPQVDLARVGRATAPVAITILKYGAYALGAAALVAVALPLIAMGAVLAAGVNLDPIIIVPLSHTTNPSPGKTPVLYVAVTSWMWPVRRW